MNVLMAWLVVILMILICISLGLALKYLIFKQPLNTEKEEKLLAEKKVVRFLTFRIIFSAILLTLSYLYLSSISA